jgi:surface antigen
MTTFEKRLNQFGVILGISMLIGVLMLIFSAFTIIPKCGEETGTYKDIPVYYNDGFNSCDGSRNYHEDGYSYGMKWQCVEYVRRFYKDIYNHEMNRYGHAKDYFRVNIKDGQLNTERNLIQYRNGTIKPQIDDIIVWGGKYGHVAIVTKVTDTRVYIIAQNSGYFGRSKLELVNNTIAPGFNVLGILRLKE